MNMDLTEIKTIPRKIRLLFCLQRKSKVVGTILISRIMNDYFVLFFGAQLRTTLFLQTHQRSVLLAYLISLFCVCLRGEALQRPQTRISDILESFTSARLLERPSTAERSQEKNSSVKGDRTLWFGL